NIIDDILQAQEDDGGFGFIPGGSDVDMTAMALQALAPYRDTYSQLTDKAVDYLASMLNDSGRYEVYGEESAETSAQVVIALCSLGIDPAQDERFTKTGGSILEGMEAYLNEDGLYAHTVGGDSDVMATQQVLLSLIALDRLRSGGDRVYDFTGLTLDSGSSTGINLKVILICAAVVVCAVIVIEVITIRRKKCNAGTDK
ncbi:MAG: terpene cyclase/mutase family protein, partial [Oscillospiraceae bacterium]|nr:terpene cyclase/mutase family protein [Oscillospiraceae bacterium]